MAKVKVTGDLGETERSISDLLLPWERFQRRLRLRWKPGEHLSIFAPTNGGKTVLSRRGLLPLRRHVLTVDVKGGDPELERDRGRKTYPERWELRRETNRFRIAPDPDHARETVAEVLGRVFKDGGWTIYIDEVRLVSDSDYLGLEKALTKLWLFARSRKVSVVGATQAPRFVPSAMYDQAEHRLIGRLQDKKTVQRLAEIISDVPGAVELIPRLPRHHFLYAGPAGTAVVRFPLK